MNIIEFIPLGSINAISNSELAIRTGCDERTVRQLVFNARVQGEIICSTCSVQNGGYYIPETTQEALPYYKQQLSRLNSLSRVLEPVQKFIGGTYNE